LLYLHIISSLRFSNSLNFSNKIFYFLRTVEKLWKITEELNILYKDNWTALADREMAIFQTELLAAGLATNGDHPSPGRDGTTQRPPHPTKESGGKFSTDLPKSELMPKDPYFGYAGGQDNDDDTDDERRRSPSGTFFNSFLYSLSLITTVGKRKV
jgi:hypothetical protein